MVLRKGKKYGFILNYMERELVASFCGFHGIILTQAEIAKRLAISQSYVPKIYLRAKRKIIV